MRPDPSPAPTVALAVPLVVVVVVVQVAMRTRQVGRETWEQRLLMPTLSFSDRSMAMTSTSGIA
jgi:hypothetical protein